MNTTKYDNKLHLELFENYKNDYNMCPVGTININHLRWYVSNAMKSSYLTSSSMKLVDMSEYEDILNGNKYRGNHWNNAIKSHFELLNTQVYDFSQESEIDRFVVCWFKIMCDHWNNYTLTIAKKALESCYASYEDDLSYEDSINEFSNDFREVLHNTFAQEETSNVDD